MRADAPGLDVRLAGLEDRSPRRVLLSRSDAGAAETFAMYNGTFDGLDVDALEANGFRSSENVEIRVDPATMLYSISASSSSFDPVRTLTFSSATGTITG